MRLRKVSSISLPVLLVLASSAWAADDIGSMAIAHTAGGLSCFDFRPARNPEGISCDRLCAVQAAVCTSVKSDGARNPGIGCADPIDTSIVASCRCCASSR